MPVRKRNIRRRALLDADEEAWLRGDAANCGLVEFVSDEKQSALWDAYGDKERFYWKPGMYVPKPTAD